MLTVPTLENDDGTKTPGGKRFCPAGSAPLDGNGGEFHSWQCKGDVETVDRREHCCLINGLPKCVTQITNLKHSGSNCFCSPNRRPKNMMGPKGTFL